MTPIRPLDGTMSGSALDRHAEQVAQLGVPGPRPDVAEHRAARVGHVGGEDGAAGEVPDDPGVDGAEREVVVDRDVAVLEHPGELGAGEVRVEDEAGPFANEREVAVGLEFVAAVGGAAVLPDDRIAVGHAGGAVPGDDGLALVRDADRADPVATDLADHVVQRVDDGIPDLLGVVLDPAGLGVVLGELAIRRNGGRLADEHGPAPDAGGPGVDGDDTVRFGHGRQCRSAAARLRLRPVPAAGGAPRRRRAAALGCSTMSLDVSASFDDVARGVPISRNDRRW